VSSSVAVGRSATDALVSTVDAVLLVSELASELAGALGAAAAGAELDVEEAAVCVAVVATGARLADAGSEDESVAAVWPLSVAGGALVAF
jgi:hypothetical protein